MITPTELYLRRLDIGIDRETMATALGSSQDGVRQAERGKRFTVFRDHIEAIEQFEGLLNAADNLVDVAVESARLYMIGDQPVVWIFDDKSFDELSWWKNYPATATRSLHALCAARAFNILRDEGANPIAAELLYEPYTSFLSNHGLIDGGVERCKWFRAWSKNYTYKS